MSSFQLFHNTWIHELRQLVQELSQVPDTEEHRRELVQKTLSHYARYYRVKSDYASTEDPLCFFSVPWATSLERSLYWVGGWRPAVAFHLLYTESSILFETHMADIFRGFRNGDLGDLSSVQLRLVNQIQCETVKQENDISNELSTWQDAAIDHLAWKYGDVDRKTTKLAGILERADQLRLRTIERLVDVLTPQQAAEFLVAAAQLCFGICGWGVKQDRRRLPQHHYNNILSDTNGRINAS